MFSLATILSTHVDTACDVTVLDQVVRREHGVVWLDDGFRDLWRGEDGESRQHSVGILLPNLSQQQCTHTRSCSSSEGWKDTSVSDTFLVDRR